MQTAETPQVVVKNVAIVKSAAEGSGPSAWAAAPAAPGQPRDRPPRSVLSWLPFWWSRVVFPGFPDAADASTRLVLLCLLVLPGLLLFPCLSFHLFEPDEGRYAQIPHEMLVRGEWIVPTLQGEPYLDKPPLFYWCVMLSFTLFGFSEWAARLVPAVATLGTILVTYFLGRRLIGARPALVGATILSLAPGFIGISRLLLLDGLLTFFVTLSLLAASLAQRGPTLNRGWWRLAALACGLGILTKGPIALVLLAPPVWLMRRLDPGQAPLGWRDVLGFTAIVAAVNLPWYAAIMLREPEFAAYFFWQHNIQRFSDPFDHQRPLWFFVPLILAGLLPATLLLPGFVRFALSARKEAALRRPAGMGFALLAGLWCFGFFSLSGCKLPTYILPAFPMLALALGCYVNGLLHPGGRGRRLVLAGGGLWLVLTLIAHHVVVPSVAEARSPLGNAEQVRQWCDPNIRVFCFPRPVDSAAFFLGRCDMESHRSKDLDRLIAKLAAEPRAVVLFSHRHSIDLLRMHLPPTLRMTEEAPLGLCKMAKIERIP